MVIDNLNKAKKSSPKWYWSVLMLFFAIFFFLFSIDMVSASVTMIGKETAQSILLATSNPFIGLFIGLLATALIQSSSTVTSMTVAVVASGYISLSNAIPIVMGANIGTTLTSTIVSLGFITNRTQFRKAISAGTVHDFFNIIMVLLLFPLEYYYGFLTRIAISLTEWLRDLGFVGNSNLGSLDYNLSSLSRSLVSVLPENFITIIIALIALFLSIKFLSNIIFTQLIGQSKDRLGKFIFDNPYKSFGWGMVITGGVQSSSITTSLMVPLVASGRVKLANSFPFIMGANIGTTLTALLAAFTKTDAAVSLALVHLIMNMIGVLIFLPFPVLRRIPVKLAYKFGAMTLESRIIGFSYIIFTFFLLPFTLIYINKDTSETQKFVYTITEINHPEQEGMIVLKTNHGNTSGQFSIFNDISNSSKTVPDTSFEANLTEKIFIGFAELTKYRAKDFVGTDAFGAYSLNLIKDSIDRTYPVGDMKHLILIEKKYQNSSMGCFIARFLVNPEFNLILEATYFDSQKEAIKTVKLRSIE
jgi:solute carrier family 34 (sodium-dependent phosphate cotransporter)